MKIKNSNPNKAFEAKASDALFFVARLYIPVFTGFLQNKEVLKFYEAKKVFFSRLYYDL